MGHRHAIRRLWWQVLPWSNFSQINQGKRLLVDRLWIPIRPLVIQTKSDPGRTKKNRSITGRFVLAA